MISMDLLPGTLPAVVRSGADHPQMARCMACRRLGAWTLTTVDAYIPSVKVKTGDNH
jgi:hypothetical protein